MTGVVFWLAVLFVVYVYAGYPLVLALFARLHPSPPEWPVATPAVTLLIAAYNEERVISAKLENCLRLDYPPECLQILVAADGSDDQTVEIVRSFADRGIELSYQPERAGKMSAINRAIPSARHDIVVFSDANNLYRTDTLRALVQPFSDPSVGVVTGQKTMLEAEDHLSQADGLYWRYESFVKQQETLLGCCAGVSGEVLAIRKVLFVPPPAAVINDDLYIALDIIKRGYRVVYVAQAVSSERVSSNERDEIIRRRRIMAGQFQLMAMSPNLLPFRRPRIVWQIVSHKLLRPLVPLGMLCALVANLLALFHVGTSGKPAWFVLDFPYNWIFFGLQLLFYLVALSGTRSTMPGLIGKILYLPTYLLNSNVAALQGLYGYLTHQQTVVWKKALR